MSLRALVLQDLPARIGGASKPPPPPYPPPPGTRGPGTYSKAILDALNNKTQPRFPQYPAHTSAPGPDVKADDPHGDSALESRITKTIVASPKVDWKQIHGQNDLIHSLNSIIREPIEHPESGLVWSGILLYGPPGTGKTMIAKAIATIAAPAKFMSISSADLGSSYASESERMIKALFTIARRNRPVVIFIDEIDSILGKRTLSTNETASNKVKTQFLIEMEGLGRDKSDILVVAATNNPWDLDDAALSRLRKRYYVGLPDESSRSAMLGAFLTETKIATSALFDPEFWNNTIVATRGMSGRELKALVEEAVVQAVTRRRKLNAPRAQIIPQDMVDAVTSTGRSITLSTLERYQNWASERRLATKDIERDKKMLQ